MSTLAPPMGEDDDDFSGLFFPDKIKLQKWEENEWMNLFEYRCIWDRGHVTAPAGFIHDLSSIPRIAQSIIPKSGAHDGPSIIHDWCYVTGWRGSRKACDDLFLAGMVAKKVPWLRRNIIYAAVRTGGWVVWNRRHKT